MPLIKKLISAPALVLLLAQPLPAAEAAKEGTVHRTATCGCCHLWNEAMAEAGFEFEDQIVEQSALMEIKTNLGLPREGAACHTAEIDGYLVEGHVPAFAIERLLTEKPKGVRGVVVPGMPPQSPGMGGPLVDYDIFLLTDEGDLQPWLRARGSEEVALDAAGPE